MKYKILLLCSLVISLPVYASKQTIFIDPGPGLPKQFRTNQGVLILTPEIIVVDNFTEKLIPTDIEMKKELSERIMKFVHNELNRNKIKTVLLALHQNKTDMLDDFTSDRYGDLFSNDRATSDNNSLIISFCRNNNKSVVLIQSLLIKVGKHGYWNPLGGAIGPSTHSSYYQAAVVDCKLKEKIWANSVFYRKIATPYNIIKLIKILYNNMLQSVETIK